MMSIIFPLVAWLWMAGLAQQPAAAVQETAADRKGRETFERVCATCHTADWATAEGRSRAQWEATMISMQTARGAVMTQEEFSTILEYLSTHYGRESIVKAPVDPEGRPPVFRGPRAHVGAADRHRVDDAAAARGQKTYAAECVTCHGPSARGSERGANLIRSRLVLRDRYGSAIGPFLKRGHPMQTGAPSAGLSATAVTDLSHFIWQRINDTLQGSPAYEAKDVLTGDASAGQAYFNGEGGCVSCHSPAGDLKGYGSRYNPVDIQQRFVFPTASIRRGAKTATSRNTVTVTVTLPNGETVAGPLVSLDDFQVALRDASGAYRSFTRTPEMKIVKNDPSQAHIDLLDRLTDKAMHDVVAYLETLK
jgi:mono/diheme cytochrome c family protein